MRIGILGGTFDPIHHGHLAAASEAQAVFALDLVLLIPTAKQPFKQDVLTAGDSHRLKMCELAAAANPYFEVSAVDINRAGITYTVDTLTDIAKEYPEAELFFIAGADSLARLPEWKDSEVLVDLAQFIAVTRAGYDIPTLPPGVPVVEIPDLAISSTDIRYRVSRGAPIKYLVPDKVADYIETESLYQGGAAHER